MLIEILTANEFAQLLRLPLTTVRALCRRGRIPGAIKTGKHWRIPRRALETMFAERETTKRR